jgi:dTDP-4-dehydrorhamnose reductase
MSEVLLIGAAGMLGRAWKRLLQDGDLAFEAPSSESLNLLDRASIETFVKPGLRTVINCGAWTAVDDAETHEAQATELNGIAVGVLAARCKDVGARLVHYSTDYVFDGSAREPYRVDEPRKPVNAYGRSKALGEELLLASGVEALLIRTSWLYAPWGKNFVLTMRNLAQRGETLRVVDDQRGRPSEAGHLARTSLALLEHGCRGIYHVTDGGECSWFELARLIAGIANPRCRVEPCASDAFPRPAKRPAYSVLDLSATEAVVGPMPDWQSQVKQLLQSLESAV